MERRQRLAHTRAPDGTVTYVSCGILDHTHGSQSVHLPRRAEFPRDVKGKDDFPIVAINYAVLIGKTALFSCDVELSLVWRSVSHY